MILLIGLATFFERPLFAYTGRAGGPPDLLTLFAAINAATGGWICLEPVSKPLSLAKRSIPFVRNQ